MATLQVDPKLPDIAPAQSLTGWHREFCLELLGDGGARIFVRAVEKSSFNATELQRAILFHRLDSRFRDIEGCVQALRPDLDRLIDTARRTRPDKDNLFATLEYDRASWEHVQQGVDRWAVCVWRTHLESCDRKVKDRVHVDIGGHDGKRQGGNAPAVRR